MKIEEKYISETVRKGIGLLAEIHKRIKDGWYNSMNRMW